MHKIHNFYIKTMKYSCVLGNEYKVTANVRDKDHKITKINNFAA